MIPTVDEVLTYAAELLGDADRDVFTDSLLMNPFQTAFEDYYRVAQKHNLPRIKRVAYYNVPAYNTSLAPATANVSDFGQPSVVWERGTLTTASITGATNATPIVLTVDSASGFADNYHCTVNGVVGPTGRINENWYITVSGTAVTLVGSVGAGVWRSGGTLTYSPDKFVVVREFGRSSEDDPPGVGLRTWEWRNSILRFPGATQARQIKIEYESSGVAPVTGSVGIDGSKPFFSHRTAAIAGKSRGMKVRGRELNQEALGEAERPDGRDGLLHNLLQPDVQQKSRVPKQPKRYRRRRQHHLGYIG